MVTEKLSLEGHLLDDGTLAKALATIDKHGVSFEVRRFKLGVGADDASLVELSLTAPDLASMRRALDACTPLGASFSMEEVALAKVDVDGVLPEGFYSTTNFTTFVLVDGKHIPVEGLEMDVAIRVLRDDTKTIAMTCPMHRVKMGDEVVVGSAGVRVLPTEQEQHDNDEFQFMKSEVSSERPKSRMIAHAADAIRAAKKDGRRVLLVGGPAIVHSGSAPLLASLITHGWIDVLFAGNALAAHDIEAAMLGTSLGVDLARGAPVPHGHSNHLRTINRVRRVGSIANAVRDGLITRGVMHACITKPIPFVLCGSIRDDGPLPDVISDTLAAVDAMREQVRGVGVALICATTLHGVATGNILPAHVKTYCVDSSADTVIKLTDRGTHQAIGLVTDCEFFLKELCACLGALPVPT